MKNIFSILALAAALLIVNSAKSQNQLLLKQDSLNQKIEDINLRLNNFSDRASTGNQLLATGIALSIIGSVVNMSQSVTKANSGQAGFGLMIVGGGLSTTGLIISLSAHRKVRKHK